MISIFFVTNEVNAQMISNPDENGVSVVTKIHKPLPTWIAFDDIDILTWDYFKGESPETYEWDAETHTMIKSNYKAETLPGDECKYKFVKGFNKAVAYFKTEDSFYIPENQTQKLLKHEKGHLDIAQIYAEKLSNHLLELENRIFTCNITKDQSKHDAFVSDVKLTTNKIDKEIFFQRDFADEFYDEQTDHSRIEEQQSRWDKILALLVRNPTLKLTEAASTYQIPTVVYQNQKQSLCEFPILRDGCVLSVYTQILWQILISFIVGGLVAVYFYIMQRKERSKFDKIIEDLGETKENRTQYAYNRLQSELVAMQNLMIKIKQLISEFDSLSIDEVDEKDKEGFEDHMIDIHFEISDLDSQRKNHIQSMEDILKISQDVVDLNDIEKITELCKKSKNRDAINHEKNEKGQDTWAVNSDITFDDIIDEIGLIRERIRQPEV